MFRILNATQDTYITNKIINGTRSIDGNMGLAGTLDLFKLYGETYYSGSMTATELSRILIKFDYSKLLSLTSSLLDPDGSNFNALLTLKHIQGGQTLPNNFSVQLYPLAKEWNEGNGIDIITFDDIDSANWLTASVNPSLVTWETEGAGMSGSIGDVCDYFVSGDLGVGSQSLGVVQSFPRGDEDLVLDISQLVSASIWGNLPNNGFRISFIQNQEDDQTTRFVKRFGSRHTNNSQYHPEVQIKYNGDVVEDDSNLAIFDAANNLYIYNTPRGIFRNFESGSDIITGSNCLLLELHASKSTKISVTSWSQSHSQSITFLSNSMIYFSASFTGSQVYFGHNQQTGSYFAEVNLDTFSNPELDNYLADQGYKQDFLMLWKSLDNSYLYASGGYVNFQKFTASPSSYDQRNYIVNITNLKQFYTCDEHSRLRVFIQDWEFDFATKRLPSAAISRVFKNMYWRVRDAYTKEVIIPFDDIGTKMSSDGFGMYFDFWFSDLDPAKVYTFEFKIVENGMVSVFNEEAFRFKVIHE